MIALLFDERVNALGQIEEERKWKWKIYYNARVINIREKNV